MALDVPGTYLSWIPNARSRTKDLHRIPEKGLSRRELQVQVRVWQVRGEPPGLPGNRIQLCVRRIVEANLLLRSDVETLERSMVRSEYPCIESVQSKITSQAEAIKTIC